MADEKTITVPNLRENFTHPKNNLQFVKDTLFHNCVVLEDISCNELAFSGIIKAKNLDTVKSVVLRTTFNNWRTYEDFPAQFLKEDPQKNTTSYKFHIRAPKTMKPGMKIEFAIYLKALQNRFWDNNFWRNYQIIVKKGKASLTGVNAQGLEHDEKFLRCFICQSQK